MKEFRAFLLSRTGWQDENGNTVVFSETNLTGETAGDGLWLFLDEGLRCGGMHRRIGGKRSGSQRGTLRCREGAALGENSSRLGKGGIKMFCEKLTEEQIRKVMNVISDDGALTILKIRTYDKSFEDAVAVSAVPEVTAKFQEDIETYQLHDYFIRGKNRAGAGSDYIYRKMMYEWFGEPYVVKYLMEY